MNELNEIKRSVFRKLSKLRKVFHFFLGGGEGGTVMINRLINTST